MQQSDHRLIIEKFKASPAFYQVHHFSQNTNNEAVASWASQAADGPMMPVGTKVSFFWFNLIPAEGTDTRLRSPGGGFAVNASSTWHITPNGNWYVEAEDSHPFNVQE